MSGDDHTYLSNTGGNRVAYFARHVLGEVSARPGQSRTARRDAFAGWLQEAVATFAGYDQDAVLDALDSARLTADDLVLHCIPQAANMLGQRWANSELSFAGVSLGSARLFGLCQARALEWAGGPAGNGGLSILLATVQGEDHSIGASVLAYRLRRSGHSVRLVTQASAERLVELLDVGCFDGLMLSACSLRNLATVADAVKHIRNRACVQPPIVLGGWLIHNADGLEDKTGVTLATNDLNAGLSLIGRSADSAFAKVAE